MRNGVIASLLVVALLAGAGAGYLVGEANLRTTTTVSTITVVSTSTTISYQAPCSTPVYPTTSSGMTDVYEVSPGSRGTICVDYHFNAAGNWSFASPDYGPLNGSSFVSCAGGGFNGTVATSCSTLRITSSVGGFSHGADQNVSVIYTVMAGENATGLFWLFIGFCDPVYVAVGSIPASVSGPIFYGCIFTLDEPSYEAVTAVSNVIVSVVPVR